MSESIVARWSDFLELTKPRVVALMLLTALIGMCMAFPGLVPWEPLVYGNLGVGLCAGAARSQCARALAAALGASLGDGAEAEGDEADGEENGGAAGGEGE